MACSDEGGVKEDLVRFAKGERELIVRHDFAVFLGAFGAHLGDREATMTLASL